MRLPVLYGSMEGALDFLKNGCSSLGVLPPMVWLRRRRQRRMA